MTTIQTIPSQAVQAEIAAGKVVDLIDVRSPAEFASVHAEAAVNIPLDRLDPGQAMAARKAARDEPLYVICHSGARSRSACEAFLNAGYDNVRSVEGGTRAWEAAGLPVVRGRSGVSVERQVRAIIGLGVLTGMVLVLATGNPWFSLVSGFFGAGLLMAGITDLCPLALLVAAMPWNRHASTTCGTCVVPAK